MAARKKRTAAARAKPAAAAKKKAKPRRVGAPKRSGSKTGARAGGAAGSGRKTGSGAKKGSGALKTRPTGADVEAFLSRIEDESMRRDAQRLVRLMRGVTRKAPEMWGSSIVGFGRYRYRYASGREGEWMLTGFSPRKREFSLYLMCGLDAAPDLLERLGKFRRGKGCLYVRRLEDVDVKVLRELVRRSVRELKERWGSPR